MADDEAANGAGDDNDRRAVSFQPVLYKFSVSPSSSHGYGYSLQIPFATLFDNAISVIWSAYNNDVNIKIGICQVQWALEFLKCMKIDYAYPENIGKIVRDLESQLILLYAKVATKLDEEIRVHQLDNEDEAANEAENAESPQAPAEPGTSGAAPAPGSAGAPGADAPPLPEHCVSYNERDILRKLHEIQIAVYHGTNKPRSLDDLDALGSRTPKEDEEECKNDANNPAKTQKDMITRIEGTLEKILEKTTEDETKTEVENLLKGLKTKNTAEPKSSTTKA